MILLRLNKNPTNDKGGAVTRDTLKKTNKDHITETEHFCQQHEVYAYVDGFGYTHARSLTC